MVSSTSCQPQTNETEFQSRLCLEDTVTVIPVRTSRCRRRKDGSDFTVGVLSASSVFILLLVIASCTLSVGAAPATNRSTTKPILAPFVRCYSSTCDLRSHYCDEIIYGCARCDDDCHVSRISGNPSAIRECQKKCEWYYVFTSTSPPATTIVTTTAQPTPAVPQLLPVRQFSQQEFSSGTNLVIVVVSMAAPVVLSLIAVILLAFLVYRFQQNKSGISRNNSMIATETAPHRRSVDDTRLVSNYTRELAAAGEATQIKVPENVEMDATTSSMAPVSGLTVNTTEGSSMTPLLKSTNCRDSSD